MIMKTLGTVVRVVVTAVLVAAAVPLPQGADIHRNSGIDLKDVVTAMALAAGGGGNSLPAADLMASVKTALEVAAGLKTVIKPHTAVNLITPTTLSSPALLMNLPSIPPPVVRRLRPCTGAAFTTATARPPVPPPKIA